ncbi:MAG: RHS repeat-associated core domain-containing protein [Luteolibacter sp.]|uniref:RHS repeat-associated core domain-containing protein n=1 Tax=Luteolibacter sp. TaxID=1962973 RepID=UPI0032667BF6
MIPDSRWFKIKLVKDDDKDSADSKGESGESSSQNAPTIPQGALSSGPASNGLPYQFNPASFESSVPIEGMGPDGSKTQAGSVGLAGMITPSLADLYNLKVENFDGIFFSPYNSGVDSEDFDVVYGNYNRISQIKTKANLLIFQPISGDGFEIQYYDASQFNPVINGSGLYDLNSGVTPFNVIRYTPVLAAADHQGGVRITRIGANGTTRVRDVLSTSAQGLSWRVIEDNVETTDYVSAFSYSGGSSEYIWSRTDQTTVTRGGSLYSKSAKYYTYLADHGPDSSSAPIIGYNFFLTQEVDYSTSTAALITTYTPDWPPTRVKSMTRPDGSWEVYNYYTGSESGCDPSWIGALRETLRPWNGSSKTGASAANSESTITTYRYPSASDHEAYGIASQVTTLPGGGTVSKWTDASSSVPTGSFISLLNEAGFEGSWYNILSGIILKGQARHEFASAAKSMTSMSVSYDTSYTPGSLWDGESFASLDEEGNGEITGYERGTFVAGVFTADETPATSDGGFIRKTSVAVRGYFYLAAVLEGTKEIEIQNLQGRVLQRELWIRDSTTTWALATTTTFEYVNWPDGSIKETVEKKDGRIVSETKQISGDETRKWDEQGIETRRISDALGDTLASTRKGVSTAGSYEAQPDILTTHSYNVRTTTTTVSGGGLSRQSVSVEDLMGRTIYNSDASGAVTTTSYPNGGRDTLTILPGGLTRLETRNTDGNIVSVTGTGVLDEIYEYSVNSSGNKSTTRRSGDLTNSPRYVTTVSDWAGRTIAAVSPNPMGTGTVTATNLFTEDLDPGNAEDWNAGNVSSRVVRTVSDSGNVAPYVRVHPYTDSSLTYQGSDSDYANGNSVLEPSGTDRITESGSTYSFEGGYWWQVSTSKTYDGSGSSSAITSISKQCLYGAPSGFASQSVSISPTGEATTASTSINRASKIVTQTFTSNAWAISAVAVNFNGLLMSRSGHDTATPTTWNYDGLGQPLKEISPRGAVTRKGYYADGKLASALDNAGKVTSYLYYGPDHPSAGILSVVTNPQGKTTTYAYSALGQVTEEAGTAAYKVTYEYDAYGAKTKMFTWRTASASDCTEWVYQAGTGLLLSKIDAGAEHTDYTYHASGKMATRTWARGAVTTWSYNAYGDITGIVYSGGTTEDNATPDVTFSGFDRLGRPTDVTQAGVGSETLSYHPGTGTLNARFYTSGHTLIPALGIRSLAPDSVGRPAGFQETANSNATTPVLTVGYEYDTAGRLEKIKQDSVERHRYTYHPDSSLISSINTLASNGTSWFRESRWYDTPGRLTGIRSDKMNGTTVSAAISSHAYDYDNLGRRTKNTFQDGSFWEYGYNDRSEVTTATRKTAAGTAIPPLASAYNYDGIGNRLASSSPVMGDHTYTPDSRNRYATITTANSRTAVGRAPAGWSIKVAGAAADGRYGEIYHRALTASNTDAPVWQSVITSKDDDTLATTRNFWYAKASFAPSYDVDGNLTNDGRWIYTWNAENRLIQMETTSEATSANHPYTKLKFVYDWQGKRIARTVWKGGTSGTPTFSSSRRWLYDGWNPIVEFSAPAETSTDTTSADLTRLNTYTWGLDLSGTLQGAGGVGGLLTVSTQITSNPITNNLHAPSYDGNGNIVAWTKSDQSAPTSRREYDAFGNTLVSEGAAPCSFGFSTKIQDGETGSYYYGYRYYETQNGRWLSSDPIEEKGGMNMYCFAGNNGVNSYDVLGMAWKKGSLGKEKSSFSTPSTEKLTIFDFVMKDYLIRITGLMSIRSSFGQALARHYLGNTGDEYDASKEMETMLSEETGWKATLKATLKQGAEYADKNASYLNIVDIFDTPDWKLQGPESDYVHYALNNYYYGNEGKMWCDSVNGETIIHYIYKTRIDDVYNFEDKGNLYKDFAGPGVTDRTWYHMSRVGLAKEFRVSGKRVEHIKWVKGNAPTKIDP